MSTWLTGGGHSFNFHFKSMQSSDNLFGIEFPEKLVSINSFVLDTDTV